ncbi:MAG TPA: sigma-54 dependent transcriptional regulator [Polyangiaceae bacterium]
MPPPPVPVAGSRAPRVLVADDQSDVVEALRLLLKSEGFVLQATSSPDGILRAITSDEHDVLLMDLNYARDTTSGREGLELIGRIREVDPTLPIVVMTAWGSIDGAVEAVRGGARDYVQKPWDSARLVATLRKEAEFGAVLRRSRRLEDEASRQRARQLPKLIAEAPSMAPVVRLLERVAPSGANVLVLGEHGTGKEVVARRIHELSDRASRPFVAFDCGSTSEGVFESELFGHVRGAFTDAKNDRAGCFELADGGTLFLDEIANMPIAQQAKLLRVLQTGEFHPVGSSRTRRADVRVVAATNVDIRREVAEGRFREDLLYRLNTVELHVPSLRERKEDVLLLGEHFLQKIGQRYGHAQGSFSMEAKRALVEHTWPGNVRELEHVVERALLMARGHEIAVEDLGLRSRTAGATGDDSEARTLDQVEQQAIIRTLARTNGSVVEAAGVLGLSRSALYRRLQHHGIKGG